jgi:ribonuclease BN (tRNA processing enzyme)
MNERAGAGMDRRRFLGVGAAALMSGVSGFSQGVGGGAKARLILLGTGGGPTPKKDRSASAQVIVVNGAAYVIDCGNGVARQLVSAGIKLRSIRDVFITHHHSDHNADYGNLLLLSWATDLDHRVDTYGPAPLKRMTELFLEMNAVDIKTRTVDEGRPALAPLIHVHEIGVPANANAPWVVMQDANVKVTAAVVKHPPLDPALAYRFDTAGRSIVISGDTAPSENLVRLAQGADVLVHEVMYLPALEKLIATEPNAVRLKEHLLASHTTTEQVGKIATAAKVKTLVLSHLVPGGFPFIEDRVWLEAVRPYFAGEILVGRDLMEI